MTAFRTIASRGPRPRARAHTTVALPLPLSTNPPMHTRSRVLPTIVALALVAGFLAPACGGGGSGSSDFSIVSISVPNNGTWQINRPMFFEFSDSVDFTTVNLNTINIAQTGGAPASGEFFMSDAKTVGFQPRCPTVDDFSDAGLLPGGVEYTIRIPGSGGLTVESTSGRRLDESQSLHFTTPNSLEPSVIFLDAQIGPPTPVIQTDPGDLAATYLELGDDPANRVYFLPRTTPDAALGADVPAGFTADLNLYSNPATHIVVVLTVNQAVAPASSNINIDTVRMEYRTAAGTWVNLAHTVQLVANCTAAGAVLRVTPTGILPQNRVVRVVLTRDFRDLVGDANLVDVTVGSFLVTTATDPGTTTPGIAGDEALEEFTVGGTEPGSQEDVSTILASPRADWGSDGTLRAGFAFGGTGGPGGDFDWKIGNDSPLTSTNHPQVILDTTFSVITNEQQTAQETVINGLVDIHNLTVTQSGQLVITGPNACTILVSGDALIDGEIAINGNNNLSVTTLDTTAQPEPGASGRGGGGRGGTGSPLTAQSDPQGEPGRGAFDAAGGGGGGGESAVNPNYTPNQSDELRRPGGGGGGTFGPDFLRPNGIVAGYTNPALCGDQSSIGYDAEDGFVGYPGQAPNFTNGANGAISGVPPPRGGLKGPRPFFDGDPSNDFWGTMRVTGGQLIRGELLDPWAGAGGGGGGDAINSNTFPTTPFNPLGDEKGAGGGGGGGSLTILALGQIRFGSHGRIEAGGGTGGGGENSVLGNITHIGGGSGGGSGGHVILQSASHIDMTAVVSVGAGIIPPGGIRALGGNGGAGRDNQGGARPGGIPTTPQLDALPPRYYPSTVSPCGVVLNQAGYTFSNLTGNADPQHVIICAGGDGGPGLIQLHTPNLTDILAPTTVGENIFKCIQPPPVGSTPGSGAGVYATINSPTTWNQMLPVFGRTSQAISKWIALGGASVNANASVDAPDPIDFNFDGTDAAGKIETIGSGTSATVPDLPSVYTGTLAAFPTLPYVADDLRTLVVPGSALTDDIYLRNPALTRRFRLRFINLTATNFDVGSASYDATTDELRLTVSGGILPLAGFIPGDSIELRPRFFRVLTDGDADSLPDSSEILVQFQATTENAQGDPDLLNASAFVTDISLLDPNVAGHPNYRFFRFQVTFDISAQGAPLTFDTPIPSLDFIRVPFRF